MLNLYLAADITEMLPECQERIAAATLKVLGEMNLIAKRYAFANSLGLTALGVSNCLREPEYLLDVNPRHEERAIGIAENDVVATNSPLANRCRLERVRLPLIEPLRTGRDRPEAKHRHPDFANVHRVAMEAPNDDSGESGCLRFECG